MQRLERASAPGPGSESLRPVAFFDLDHTVLSCSTAIEYVRFMVRRGEIGPVAVARIAVWLLRYRAARLDEEAVTRRVLGELAGADPVLLQERCWRWVHRDILPRISETARACIEEHRRLGHAVVLLTAAIAQVAEPVAAHLELDACLATQLEVRGGRFSGRAMEPLCFGSGKVVWAERWLAAHDRGLGAAYFYSDSYTDRPMLDLVAHPVAVNPDRRLRRHAARRGWPVLRWR